MDTLKLFGDWAPLKKKPSFIAGGSINLINLEGPIIDSDNLQYFKPNKKVGPYHLNYNLPESDNDFIFILANNHLFDYGLEGYESTIKAIKKKKWNFLGAGLSKKQACDSVIFEFQKKKIGLLSRSELQFGVAQENKAGVAPLDSNIYEQIQQLKKKTDFVIVSIHAGAEMFPWPSPRRQDSWRSLIDAGADIIHGHTSHIPQGWERYKKGIIFYGLGNFCVDPANWSWHPNGLWSLTPEISLTEENIEMQLKTMVVENNEEKISLRESSQKEQVSQQEYLKVCNQPLTDRLLLEGLWQEASVIMYDRTLSSWLGFNNSPVRIIYQFIKDTIYRLGLKKLENIHPVNVRERKDQLRYHLFSCETHSDTISTALGLLGGELKDLRTKETALLVNKYMLHE